MHSRLFDGSGRWLLGAEWRMLFVCDILEHLEEMIGQSAINRRSQSFIPNSLRGYRSKKKKPHQVPAQWGGDGLTEFVLVQVNLCWDGREEAPQSQTPDCVCRALLIIQLIAWGS